MNIEKNIRGYVEGDKNTQGIKPFERYGPSIVRLDHKQ